jgi:hypothetical protein
VVGKPADPEDDDEDDQHFHNLEPMRHVHI